MANDSVNTNSNGTTNNDINNNVNENGKMAKNDESECFEWTNFNIQELTRGTTPEHIEQQCLHLCQQYIGGSWLNASNPTVDITVTRVTGGLTNQLYHVRLNDTVRRVRNPVYSGDDEEPTEVAIKLYQTKHMKNFKQNDNERLNDNIILIIMSEMNLGPRVYGIFDEGFIQAYHKHEQFRVKHQRDPVLLRKLAKLMASIHQLKVPLCKTKDFMLEDVANNLREAYTIHQIDSIAHELSLPLFTQRPMCEEFAEMVQLIESLASPVVFCHNDFRGSNLLISESTTRNIVAVDLEYGGYGARAFDLATFFTEWDKDNLKDRFICSLPPDDAMEMFVRMYIDECDRLVPGYRNREENSVQKVIQEIKVFTLIVFLFCAGVMLKTTESIFPDVKFDIKQMVKNTEINYKNYFNVKQTLIKEGIIAKNAFLPK